MGRSVDLSMGVSERRILLFTDRGVDMITRAERAVAAFAVVEFSLARSSWISRARAEAGRKATAFDSMREIGFAPIDVPAGQLLTEDGREILHMHGKSWVLQPEIHAKRLAEAMEQARKRDAAMAEQQSQPSQSPTTCMSLIDGQLCGGTLVRASVCPRCALGKSGVTATLTCDVCGHVTAIMRGGCNG